MLIVVNMKDKILDGFITLIKKYYNYDDVKLKEIRYGLESLYLSIFKTIVILILSFFIHTTKELCLIFIFYGLLRLTAFGLHSKKSIHCWILSIITFSLIPYLIKTLNINSNYLIYLSIIPIILIFIYAPADTEKRPLINKKKRTIFKIISCIVSIIYMFIMILSKNSYIIKLLFFSLLLESILILPITYKLLGLKYNNYKRYKERRKKE